MVSVFVSVGGLLLSESCCQCRSLCLVGDGVGFRQCRGSVVVRKLLSVSVSPLSLVGDGGVGFCQCRGSVVVTKLLSVSVSVSLSLVSVMVSVRVSVSSCECRFVSVRGGVAR